jgi:Cu/Ag efflux pump CusA
MARHYLVTLNLAQMQRLDITRNEIETALKQFGADTAAGFIDQHSREYLIRNLARTTKLEDLETLTVAYRKGVVVRLGQGAAVDYAARIKRADAGYMGTPSRRSDSRRRHLLSACEDDACPGRAGAGASCSRTHLRKCSPSPLRK